MKRKSRKGITLVIVVLGLFAMLAAVGLVIDTGIVLNSQNELQKQVETAALFGATQFEPKFSGDTSSSATIKVDTNDIENATREIFDIAKPSMLFKSSIPAGQVSMNTTAKAIKVTAEGSVPVFFLGLLGAFDSVKINAQAAALSTPFFLSPNFPKTPFAGSVMDSTTVETEIRKSLGVNSTVSLDSSDNPIFDPIYGYPDNEGLSLGPGGYITIRLPVPAVDEPGADLYIRELGNQEGYFVFAGVDRNPASPYVDEGDQGDGIEWVNISCTGVPEGVDISNSRIGSYYDTIEYLAGNTGLEAKFYGSGYFDFGASCTRGSLVLYNGELKNAKYIRIVDDNAEDGFLYNNPIAPALLPGEHSSVTQHHLRMIFTWVKTKDHF